jgi:multidrug efflux pump subunit AcrA (membrane-fusion protein)
MAELNKQEIQSPELQEVMSEIPGSFLKWGLFVFFGIILILIAGSYFIKNPEKVSVPVVITTQNPPVTLVAKSGGEIKRLFVSEGSIIKKDNVVALINNSSNYEDIKTLNFFLSDFDDKSDWIEVVKTRNPPPDLSLGEIQSNYSGFQKQWKEMKDYLEQAYIPAKLSLLEKQIEKKIDYNMELVIQKKYLTEDLALAKSSFRRDSALNKNEAISSYEFEKSRQTYVQKLYTFSVFNASIINNESDFLSMKENRMDLQVQYEKEIKQYVFSMEESLQLLRSSISQWEEKYVIKSPITGKVTLTQFRNVNQVIKAGETLATVIPDSLTSIIVRAVIPISGFGKIEIGQMVNIKLSGFPYMQYGVLQGRIYSVSQVPGEGGFSADIELVGGMTSTYREKIRFIHDMDGTAEIITRNTRLINRFLNPVRSTIKNN